MAVVEISAVLKNITGFASDRTRDIGSGTTMCEGRGVGRNDEAAAVRVALLYTFGELERPHVFGMSHV